MAWTPKVWVDRSVEFAGRRKLTAVSGQVDTFDVVRAEGNIFVVGDEPDAENLNAEFGHVKTELDALNTNLNAVETNVANLMFKKILKVTGTSGASNVDTKIANFPSGANWTNTVILSCMVEWTAASKKMFAHQYEWCFLKSDGIYFTSGTAEFSVKPVEIVIGVY